MRYDKKINMNKDFERGHKINSKKFRNSMTEAQRESLGTKNHSNSPGKRFFLENFSNISLNCNDN